MLFLFCTHKNHFQFKNICDRMNEVVAEASISPSSSFCLDLSFQKLLGQGHTHLGSRGLEQDFGVTLWSLNPASGTYYKALKKLFNPYLYFIWKMK